MAEQQYLLDLKMTAPPLNANHRPHWAVRARAVREARRTAKIMARKEQLPKDCARVRVRLIYRPRDRRRRDPGNIAPTQKAALDGLVDYGLVPDDCPPYVQEYMPEILAPEKGQPGQVWLQVEVLEP